MTKKNDLHFLFLTSLEGFFDIHSHFVKNDQPDEVVKNTMGTGRHSNGFLLTPIENRQDLKGEKI
jgi:hypothetical protein